MCLFPLQGISNLNSYTCIYIYIYIDNVSVNTPMKYYNNLFLLLAMEEGRYSIQFAFNESITAYHYNKCKDANIEKEWDTTVVTGQITNEHLMTYQIRPQIVEFNDCVRYISNSQGAYDLSDYISCEPYTKDQKRPVILPWDKFFNPSDSDETSICYGQWNQNSWIFNISLDDMSQNDMNLALTCRVPLLEPKFDIQYRALFRIKTPSNITSNKIMGYFATTPRQNTEGMEKSVIFNAYSIAIVVILCNFTIFLITTAVIMLYKKRKNKDM